ncbi:GGDEF domain-containing phosphodiesterase [Sulfitobacter albidus]|uniref:GGDEF domain-containing phosphodiesterase n=1 Tax=Sulfitobacter albidus TaxID=2829501 RepID=UPI0020C86FE8|nr:GGDEF domain-containing phosphodiesterase [Sulfitobacter albidus]
MNFTGYKPRALRKRIFEVLTGPPALAFVPALSLAAFWFGGEGALLVVAALLPVFYLLTATGRKDGARRGAIQVPLGRAQFEDGVAERRKQITESGQSGCLYLIEIDQLQDLISQHGAAACDHVIDRVSDRLIGAVRAGDLVGRLDKGTFAICAAPLAQHSLEMCIQMAVRLQAAAEDAIAVDGTVIYPGASVGLCQASRAPGTDGTAWLNATQDALQQARERGGSAMRAFTGQRTRQASPKTELKDEVEAALGNGEILPWFQPQLSTETGRISGFEALARWVHPTRGVLSPAEFLPLLEENNLLDRLAEVMMHHSLKSLKSWDRSGLDVPSVGVNFSGSDLGNPQLLEKIEWDLDRFELTPERLTVEVLETVVASAPDDMVARNIKKLEEMGCGIDLDDFGTGNASFLAVRRFKIRRLKIDRSFVSRADRDPEQQRLIGAMLTMAERLDLETLAEGVETAGEHALLAQLGCHHVQGFGIARPMPFDQTAAWIAQHTAKLHDVPQIVQRQQK